MCHVVDQLLTECSVVSSEEQNYLMLEMHDQLTVDTVECRVSAELL